jgi:ATP-dependent RNA helicase DeaD
VAITLAEPREHRMLKTIERVTKQRIPVEKVPTVADLRARRLELTRAALHELLLEDDLEPFRVVVETLTDDFDIMQVALAAVKLAHEAAGGGTDTDEIPEAAAPPVREDRAGKPGSPRTSSPRSRASSGPMARLFIGAGRSAGIRPQDVVGAIANESRLSGRDIGAIEIADRFSVVEVPEDAADDVISALQQTRIKGRRPQVSRYRENQS